MNLIVCSIYTYYFLVESIFQQTSYGSNFGKHRKDEFAIFWVDVFLENISEDGGVVRVVPVPYIMVL